MSDEVLKDNEERIKKCEALLSQPLGKKQWAGIVIKLAKAQIRLLNQYYEKGKKPFKSEVERIYEEGVKEGICC